MSAVLRFYEIPSTGTQRGATGRQRQRERKRDCRSARALEALFMLTILPEGKALPRESNLSEGMLHRLGIRSGCLWWPTPHCIYRQGMQNRFFLKRDRTLNMSDAYESHNPVSISEVQNSHQGWT